MAKSRKRSRAARLAWRRRRNPIVRRRRRNVRRRRRNPAAWAALPGMSTKRKGRLRRKHRMTPAMAKAYGAPKRRRRKARKGYTAPKRRRTRKGAARRRRYSRRYRTLRRYHGHRAARRGKIIYVYPKRRRSRSKAMKAAWRRRRSYGGLRRLKGGWKRRYVTSRGKKYHHARMTRGHFTFWRNPGLNMAAIKEVVLPVGLALGGIIVANLLMKKVQEQSFYSKIPVVAGMSLGALIPAVIGIAGIAMLAKKMPAQAGLLKGLGFGLIMASGATVWNQLIAPKLSATNPPKVAFGGYVTESMEGYVRSPLAGYVRSLGQLDESFARSLGEPVEFRGELAPLGVPSERALDYETATVKPYGLGIPAEERRYNDFAWRGVYGKGVYEK